MTDLRFYWSLLLQRLPVMLALLIVCTALGVVTAIRAPSTYSTTARLLVEGPQISTDRTNRQSDNAAETMQVIEQQLMTRANLIDIANKFNVFSKKADLTPDEKVARMRNATVIRSSAGRDQAALMSVTFTDERAKTAADVVNEYVTLITSANTRDRMGRAEEQLSFFQQEVERQSSELNELNARILQFKREHADALPENLQYRQDRQSLVQERLSRLETDRSTFEAQRADMLRVFQQTGAVAGGAAPTTPEEEKLAALRIRLAQAQAISSNGANPRIRGLQAQIAALEKTIQPRAEPGEGQTGNPTLDLSIAQIDSRLASIKTEAEQANKELDELKTSIAATATNSIALEALQRDQASAQARYDSAVASLAEARTNERIESTARGQRITVIDAAAVPSVPSGPHRKKIAAAGAGAGLGLAVGFFALLEFLNTTIRRPAELRARFNITPLAVIPYIESQQQRRKRLSVGLALILAVLTLIPIGLWYLHNHYMPLDILTLKIMERLGLG